MESGHKKTIAVYYPYFMGGGAEAVGLWMLEALRNTYDLTLFTVAGINFERLNTMYGTHLSSDSVKVRSLASASLRSFCNFLIANNGTWRMLFLHLLIRDFKAHHQQYDLVASAFNAMDLGRKGIQYIHWVKVLEGKPFFRKISNFSQEQLKSNISIANSCCVANQIKKTYGIDSTVIFPPVVIDVPEIQWNQKGDAFICSGRIVKAKQPHKVIQILSLVRKQGFDIKLHMTGGGGGASEMKYNRFVKKMVEDNADWVTLYEDLPYKDYVNVMTQCKYGIHFKQEPFGISIAEMVKAGAIPFVRGEGGQVEIVGEHNNELFFNSDEEAVKKIVQVLSDTHKQKNLLDSLTTQRELFSTHKFMGDIQKVVDHYFETQVVAVN